MKSGSGLLAAALLAGLALRLGLLLAPTASLATKTLEPTADSPEYVRLATNLVRAHVFSQDSVPPYRPDIFRTPVYPLLLALPMAAFGSSLVWPVLLQVLISLATVWLTRKLGLELGLAPLPSALAALLAALSPNLVFLSTKLVTETLFTLLLVVTILLANRFRVHHRWQELVAAGACSGLLILTRPIATYFPFLIAVYLLFQEGTVPAQGLYRKFKAALVLLAAASIVVLPWVIRNGRLTGRYIVSTVSEHNIYLYSGALVTAADRSISLTEARDSMMTQAQAQYGPLDSNDEASYWAALAKVGWQRTLARPLLALKIHAVGSAGSLLMPISIRPLLVFTGADPTARSSANPHVAQQTIGLLARGIIGQALALVWRERLAGMPVPALAILAFAILFHTVLLVFCLAGLFLRRSRGLLWLLLPILYFTLLTGPVGDARFRAPIEPLLCLFAAVALMRPRRSTPARTPGLSPELTSELTRGSSSAGLSTLEATHAA